MFEGLNVITVLRDAWLNGNDVVRDAHRAALNDECPVPLKSCEPVNLLIAVIEVEKYAHQLDLIINVVGTVQFLQCGKVDAMNGERGRCEDTR